MQAVRAKHRQGGFTLTELLVASAIFMILMSALAAMFNAAVTSVRQGYASIDLFETGRQAMTVLGRDLGSGFTAREYGDVYNFYGRPEGFMFVGALDSGQLGRVTYVMHSTAANGTIRTTVSEKWGTVENNIRRQIQRLARDQGLKGSDVETAVTGIINDVVREYPPGAPPRGVNPTQSGYNPDAWIDFDVELVTGSLIRYEETGASDLDTFDMYVKLDSGGLPVRLDWPYVDPIEPGKDATPLAGDGDVQQEFLLSALDPYPDGTGTYDMREFYKRNRLDGGWFHPVTGDQLYLRALGRDAFDQMLKARKREFWIRMLSGEPMGLSSLASDVNYGSVGYWHDERLNAPNTRQMRVINEYIIADGVVIRTKLFKPGTDIAISPLEVDILDAEVKFSYGDGTNEPMHYFNDIQNLRDPDNPDGLDSNPAITHENVPMLLAQGAAGYSEADLIEADNALADDMLGNRSSRSNMGSPLAPRIPALVTADFWVTRTRTRPGAPDMLKHFSQTIQIPTAQGRSVSSTIAQGPGASL